MPTPTSFNDTVSQATSVAGSSAVSAASSSSKSDEGAGRNAYVSPTSAANNECVYLPNTTPLKVMSWNIWKGGAEIEHALQKQADVIQRDSVDIVFIQESHGDGAVRLARKLGLSVAQQGYDCAVLTAFPVRRLHTSTEPYATAALIETSLGDVLAWSVHLAPWDYGPYRMDDLKHQPEVVFAQKGEQLRTQQAQRILAETTRLQASLPQPLSVIIAGDFNVPSGADWTGSSRPAVQWPATQQFIDQGYQDAFRVCHPDIARAPGLTWSFIEPLDREPRDRIDFIYVKGLDIASAHHLGSIVEHQPIPGEEGFTAYGDHDSLIPAHERNDFPSDHFAVCAEVRL